ncbi:MULTISPECIES: hypothetical protein [unclassified Treponema]|uniref:hypothetical protein n=1 Tax=unclassified Treponema TaxID=2638727 RepID=UPI0020A3163A|nr:MULTISPECIES: hypothetical protein [unclassified Treponema]UTC68059.1 hypothetical protein E4O06_05300 [Treponema sp. OMZ 789]UTC70781.1 hypothetical protein E4O01_05445 [Treponema sp. OMZ 790]UTC73521.1 hypothetical protein E4O02_05640 [Treponema sp. OMZ 791]
MPTTNLTRLKEISRRPKESLEAIGTDDIAFIQDFLTCKTMRIYSAGAIRIMENNLTF